MLILATRCFAVLRQNNMKSGRCVHTAPKKLPRKPKQHDKDNSNEQDLPLHNKLLRNLNSFRL
jgi:hypothetical protein